ncbi:hypothetical protein BDL97_02G051500 [Sphagnum fallax]|nr:hypothetical protein BDL97_02G051500 [Sphagnum fallax]
MLNQFTILILIWCHHRIFQAQQMMQRLHRLCKKKNHKLTVAEQEVGLASSIDEHMHVKLQL